MPPPQGQPTNEGDGVRKSVPELSHNHHPKNRWTFCLGTSNVALNCVLIQRFASRAPFATLKGRPD